MSLPEVLRCESLCKYYGTRGTITKAVDNLDLSIEQGEFVAIMGPSGCGKSTLLNCIATIDRATSGKVYIEGKLVSSLVDEQKEVFRRERLGFVFQQANLLDTLTIQENIGLALSINQVDPKRIAGCVQTVAVQLGIADVLNKYPLELSGGQRQRAACARALVAQPALILADEPTGALDSNNTRIVLESLQDMHAMGATIVMVTHDAVAASYSKRVLFMKDGSLYTELYAGDTPRQQFLSEVLDVVSLLGAAS